jgi:exosortase K
MRVMQELTGVFPLSLWERARERDYAAALSLTIARKRLCDLQSRLRERIKKYFAQLSPLPRPFSQGEKGGLHRNSFAQFAFVLLCAGGLKFFYSTTSVNQLRWILAPTTALVELISGQSFQFESHAGYINSDHSFLIAASCAGVNFLITAFLMLALGHLWRNRSQRLSWKFVPYAALIAYLVTLVANTVRITTALQLRAMRVESGLLSPGQLHRFEGIFIYFGFLLLLYVISDFLSSAASPTAAEPGVTRKCLAGNTGALIFRTQTRAVALQSLNAEARQRRPVTLQRCLFPLVIYYGTTLGIPFLNGAFRQADFWEHSAFVLLIPLVFVIPFAGFVFLRRISRAIKLS